MTIEELSLKATDKENFSLDGEVVVQMSPEHDSDVKPRYAVRGAFYDEQKKELVIEVD